MSAITDHILNRPAEAAWAALEVFKAKRPRLFLFVMRGLLLTLGALTIYFAVVR